MEFLNNEKLINSLIYTLPLFWGVWEFRQFRKQLTEINNKLDDITNNNLDNYPFLKDTKDVLSDIKNNNLDNYPFLKDTKDLLDNINQVFYISSKKTD